MNEKRFVRDGYDMLIWHNGSVRWSVLLNDGNVLTKWYRSDYVVFSSIKCDNGYEVRIEEKNDGLMRLSSIGVIMLIVEEDGWVLWVDRLVMEDVVMIDE